MSPSTITSHEIASIQIPLPTCSNNTTNNDSPDSSKNETITKRKVKPLKTWTYRGYSRAGTATSFLLVEPKWILDCGCSSIISNNNPGEPTRPTCIFITHTHADHIQTLHQILFSQKPIMATTTTTTTTINANTIHVYFPASAKVVVQNFLQSYYELIRDTDDWQQEGASLPDNQNASSTTSASPPPTTTTTTMEQAYNFQLHPVQVNEEFKVTAASHASNSQDIEYVVRIVQCCHRKACIGYSIFQRQRIWMEPFRSMSGPELGQYIKSHRNQNSTHNNTNVNVNTTTMISNMKEWSPLLQPILCFLGDTTTEVFTLHPELLQQHTIIAMECTYYYGTIHDEQTNIHQHTYWEVLRTKIVQRYPNILFLLQHFSNRHRRHEWIQWMVDYNQNSGHYNVHPMLISSTRPTNNTVATVSDVTGTLLDVVPIDTLAVYDECGSDKIASTGTTSLCNCFLCQPTLGIQNTSL